MHSLELAVDSRSIFVESIPAGYSLTKNIISRLGETLPRNCLYHIKDTRTLRKILCLIPIL